jgi:hypothetical protein
LPRLASLTIQVDGAPPAAVTVTLDGVVVPSVMLGTRRPTNPGAHKVEAVVGTEHETLDVLLREGEHAERSFQFRTLAATLRPPVTEPSPSQTARVEPAPNTAFQASPGRLASDDESAAQSTRLLDRPLALALVSVGAAGLLTSAITALSAKAQCKDNVCASESALGTHDSLKTASTVTFYLGAAFAVGGVVTWFVAPKAKQHETRLGLKVGPGGVSMHGRF